MMLHARVLWHFSSMASGQWPDVLLHDVVSCVALLCSSLRHHRVVRKGHRDMDNPSWSAALLLLFPRTVDVMWRLVGRCGPFCNAYSFVHTDCVITMWQLQSRHAGHNAFLRSKKTPWNFNQPTFVHEHHIVLEHCNPCSHVTNRHISGRCRQRLSQIFSL